ncbi:TVP38/TMEM64 family protein [Streptococcus dentiloxodontae]
MSTRRTLHYSLWQRIIQVLGILALIASFIAIIWLYKLGILNDQNALKDLVKTYKVIGPLIFIGVQILQVVFPVIPGGITTVAGFLIFGLWQGFLFNYIGILIGSGILFLLVKHFGRKFILLFLKEDTFYKYERKLESKGYERFFILCMLSPISPADALVMVTALTNMSFKRFMVIQIICKPVSIIAYSYVWIYGADFLNKLFH